MRNPVMCAGALLLSLPLMAQGQSCVGSHAPRGSFGVGGGAAFNEFVTSFRATAGKNLVGPVFVAVSYDRLDFDGVDEGGNSLGGSFGLETRTSGDISICVFSGGNYTWFGIENADADGFGISGGSAIGYSASVGDQGLFVTPNLRGGITHRELAATAFGFTGFSGGELRTDAFVRGGLTFGSDRIWLATAVTQLIVSGATPILGVNVGYAFP